MDVLNEQDYTQTCARVERLKAVVARIGAEHPDYGAAQHRVTEFNDFQGIFTHWRETWDATTGQARINAGGHLGEVAHHMERYVVELVAITAKVRPLDAARDLLEEMIGDDQ